MVSADAARTVVGILGNITSLGLYLSPVPTFIQICKKGSVQQFSAAPYLAAALSCMLWVVYGLPFVRPNSTLLITISCSGVAIELVYICLFLLYSGGKKRMKVFLIFLLEVAFVLIVTLLVLKLAHTYHRRSLIVGSLCVVFGALMYAAPLSVMNLVIRTKSVEYMPFFPSLASCVNGICWVAYSLIRFDLFITIPSSLGTLFGLAQLILYATFYKSTKRQIGARKAEGETNFSEIDLMDQPRERNGLQNGRLPEIGEP